jgi:tRNA pseudouridine32 synthase/23S rRNA pseudouridine746 synthase
VSGATDHAEVHVVIESPDDSAVDVLHEATGLSKQRIKLAMSQGAVWVTRGRNTRRLRRVKRALSVGDEVHLYYDAGILAEIPPEPALIADVAAYSVWRKPCGLRSQGSKWGDHCTVVRWAERHLRPVHRLDRAANGLILVAHSRSIAAILSALFRDRKMEKRYRAVVAGDFSGQPNPVRVELPIGDRESVSEISWLQTSDDRSRSLVDVTIETGRKHQIRRHLADLGYPILGDRLYGAGATDGVDLQLTAYLLAFHCPVAGEQVEYRLGENWLPDL